jgi:hypothetical protein
MQVSSHAGLWGGEGCSVRKLKHTVNKVCPLQGPGCLNIPVRGYISIENIALPPMQPRRGLNGV